MEVGGEGNGEILTGKKEGPNFKIMEVSFLCGLA